MEAIEQYNNILRYEDDTIFYIDTPKEKHMVFEVDSSGSIKQILQ